MDDQSKLKKPVATTNHQHVHPSSWTAEEEAVQLAANMRPKEDASSLDAVSALRSRSTSGTVRSARSGRLRLEKQESGPEWDMSAEELQRQVYTTHCVLVGNRGHQHMLTLSNIARPHHPPPPPPRLRAPMVACTQHGGPER